MRHTSKVEYLTDPDNHLQLKKSVTQITKEKKYRKTLTNKYVTIGILSYYV